MKGNKENTVIATFQGISNSKKRAFLVAYARTGRITAASRLSRMQWRSHYNWLRDDPDYERAFEEAKRMAADFAEDDVLKRAFEGEYKPIIYQGKIRGRYKEKSDMLAMFALKGLMPQKYREGAITIVNAPKSFTFALERDDKAEVQDVDCVERSEPLPILPPAGEKA